MHSLFHFVTKDVVILLIKQRRFGIDLMLLLDSFVSFSERCHKKADRHESLEIAQKGIRLFLSL